MQKTGGKKNGKGTRANEKKSKLRKITERNRRSMIKRKKSKKALTLILAFLIAFTYMPFGIGAEQADATSGITGSFKEGRVLESADGSTFKYTGNDAGWMQIYFVSYEGRSGGSFKVGPAKEVSPIRAYRVNGDVAYCLEHGVMADETVKLTGKDRDKAFLEETYRKSDSGNLEYILNNMSLCLLYGRQSGRSIEMLENKLGFKESAYYGRNAKSYSLDDWEVATRQLIHESQQRFRDDKFDKLSSNGLYFEDYWYKGVSNPGNGNGKKIPQSHYRKPLEGTGAVVVIEFVECFLIKIGGVSCIYFQFNIRRRFCGCHGNQRRDHDQSHQKRRDALFQKSTHKKPPKKSELCYPHA